LLVSHSEYFKIAMVARKISKKDYNPVNRMKMIAVDKDFSSST